MAFIQKPLRQIHHYAAPIHLEMRECDVASIWRKEWENLTSLRADNRVLLQESTGCTNAVSEVDVHRIEQVFRNIFENAIHACGNEGTVTIRCSAAELHGVFSRWN